MSIPKMLHTLKKSIKFIFNSDYRFMILASYGFFKRMDDAKYLKRMFKGSMGYDLDLNSPKTFNEKIQWLKLYDRKPNYIQMVDKYKAKEFVMDSIGNEYVIPTYGVWKSFDSIDFDRLPEQFVLKTTHDSGSVVICRNKETFDFSSARRILEKSLNNNFYYALREWPYKDVEPRIIAEMYLESKESDCGITDYKFFCFNGSIKFLYISKGLEEHSTARISFFDLDGRELDFYRSDYKRLENFVLPNNYLKMKKIAEKLAKVVDSPFVRIDLYSVNGKIYFSEITLSPCGGFLPFYPKSADIEVGKLLELNINNFNNEV